MKQLTVLGDLTTDPYNIIEHDKKNMEAIKASLGEVGAGRSVVTDEDGKILAGHGAVAAAKELGLKIKVVDGDRDTLVVVRRSDLTDQEKIRLGLWDNRASDLHKYNKQAVARLNEAHPEQQLLLGVFSEREQEKLLRAHADAQELAPGGTDDDVPETSSVGVRAESGVRMVSIFADTVTQPLLVKRVRELSPLFGTTTLSDTVIAIVERAHREWITKEEASSEGDSTDGSST